MIKVSDEIKRTIKTSSDQNNLCPFLFLTFLINLTHYHFIIVCVEDKQKDKGERRNPKTIKHKQFSSHGSIENPGKSRIK